ncbi:MAG: hypothetical protein AAFZ65_20150 [Planctomycetota bacterium]
MIEYEVVPKGWLHRQVEVRPRSGVAVVVSRNGWATRATFDVDGQEYVFRVHTRWRGMRYTLERDAELLARAQPTGTLCSSLELELFTDGAPESPIPLPCASYWSSKYELRGAPPFEARIEPRGLFSMGQKIAAHPDLPLAFVVFLGMVANSVAMHNATVIGAGGAGAGAS